MTKFFRFFDKLEDKVRSKLSHFPIFYGIIGGTFMVLFWRGIWHTADIFEGWGGWWAIVLSGPGTIIFSTIALLLTGLFVSSFIGNHIIISGLKKEKKLIDKTEDEIVAEKGELSSILADLEDLKKRIYELGETKGKESS